MSDPDSTNLDTTDIFEDGIVLQDDDLDLFIEYFSDETVEEIMVETGLDNYYDGYEDDD